MREEPKSLAEWLESKGNPKHSIAKGDGENMVMAVEDDGDMTLYNFVEKPNPFGGTYFWMSSGWGVRKEFFPAIKNFLNDETETNPHKLLKFEVWEWYVGGDGEYANRIDAFSAVSEYNATILLGEFIKSGKYPKGSWLVYYLNGEKIELDTKGRIPA